MGIAKSVMVSVGRSIVGRASSAAEGSSRIQDFMSVGAQLLGANDASPDKPSMLANLFQEQVLGAARKGIVSALTDAGKGKGDHSSILDAAVEFALSILKKVSAALESVRENRMASPGAAQPSLMSAGTDLKTLIQQGSSVGPIGMLPLKLAAAASPPGDARLDAWLAEERASRGAYGDTERQMREKSNIVELLKTDMRLNPGQHAPEVLGRARLQLERAQELHMGSVDRRVALTEAGKEFGSAAESVLRDAPIPLDWNIPKAYVGPDWDAPKVFIGEDWNQPSPSDGPSR